VCFASCRLATTFLHADLAAQVCFVAHFQCHITFLSLSLSLSLSLALSLVATEENAYRIAGASSAILMGVLDDDVILKVTSEVRVARWTHNSD
jgi:hypothetical protein